MHYDVCLAMLTEVATFLNRKGGRDHIVSCFLFFFFWNFELCREAGDHFDFQLQGQFILISDSLTNGGFLIHHYVTQALKGEETEKKMIAAAVWIASTYTTHHLV